MTATDQGEWLLVITRSDEHQIRSTLRDEPSITVTELSPDDDIEAWLDSPPTAWDDRLTSEGTDAATRPEPAETPDGVVVALDRPAVIQATLDRLSAVLPSVPTIVAPVNGCERVAVAALRGGATEYIRSESDDTMLDRILTTVRSASEDTGHTSGRRSADGSNVLRSFVDELPDEAFIISEDGTYLDVSVRDEASELYTLSPADLIGSTLDDAFPDATARRLQSCLDRAVRTGETQSIEYETDTTDGRRCFEARVVPIGGDLQGSRSVLWLARDSTERTRRVRALQFHRDRLETLNRINAVVREVIETMVEAPTRDAIEREVCRQLVDSELYCGSWVAELSGDRSLVYRTGAGAATTVLETVSELTPDRQPTIRRAVETGAVQTVTGVAAAEEFPDELQEAADADDVAALIAVPISYEETTYGVLTVLASREDAFTEREQAEFQLLGETIGFTIQAVKNRQLLRANTVVELEFRICGGDTFSFDLSTAYDCTCRLEWTGTTTDGKSLQYVTVEGLDAETVLAEAQAHDSTRTCRLIQDGTNRCTIELELSSAGLQTLTNHGATIRELTVEEGVGSCLVEVPQDADVRGITEALTAVFENTDLVARRTVNRPVRTASERRARILDQVTDRQLTTLQLAYYSGFFDWPRESTGEEIAETMDIAAPTMHQHLRKGLKTVLGEILEDRDEAE